MVNGPAAEEAPEIARDNPELGIGLHVAFTGLRSSLGPRAIPSLLDAEGLLPARPDGLVRARPEHLLAEARAQFRRFRELLGRLPTHFDSHHHAHRLPAVLEALLVLAWETGLPVRAASPEVQARLRLEGLRTTDAFRDEFFGAAATPETLCRVIGDVGPGVTELMCHPAEVDDALRQASSYAEPRSAELAALTGAEARQTLQATGVRLVDFTAV